MHRVPEILQLSIVVERAWSLAWNASRLRNAISSRAGIPAECRVLQELGQTRLVLEGVAELGRGGGGNALGDGVDLLRVDRIGSAWVWSARRPGPLT